MSMIRSTDRRSKHARKYEKLARKFAENLREIRGDKTVRAFADLHSMHPAQWNRLETGRMQPTFTMFLELCDKLNRTPDELIYGNGRKRK
jgi:transcriptional regulator with XRE-family HTH domain